MGAVRGERVTEIKHAGMGLGVNTASERQFWEAKRHLSVAMLKFLCCKHIRKILNVFSGGDVQMFVLIAKKNFIERVGDKGEDTNPIIWLVLGLGLRLVYLIEGAEILQPYHGSSTVTYGHTCIDPGRGRGKSLQ